MRVLGSAVVEGSAWNRGKEGKEENEHHGKTSRQASSSSSRISVESAFGRNVRSPTSFLPHLSSSKPSGFSATAARVSSSSTNICRCSPSGGTVAKIFPFTRKE